MDSHTSLLKSRHANTWPKKRLIYLNRARKLRYVHFSAITFNMVGADTDATDELVCKYLKNAAVNLHDLYANRKLSTSTLVIICSENARFWCVPLLIFIPIMTYEWIYGGFFVKLIIANTGFYNVSLCCPISLKVHILYRMSFNPTKCNWYKQRRLLHSFTPHNNKS